jgi:hypothetical protein
MASGRRRGPARFAKHPRQPLITDPQGVVRFKANAIVRFLMDCCAQGRRVDLNDIAALPFSDEDRRQFHQLLGYSQAGYWDLPFAERE